MESEREFPRRKLNCNHLTKARKITHHGNSICRVSFSRGKFPRDTRGGEEGENWWIHFQKQTRNVVLMMGTLCENKQRSSGAVMCVASNFFLPPPFVSRRWKLMLLSSWVIRLHQHLVLIYVLAWKHECGSSFQSINLRQNDDSDSSVSSVGLTLSQSSLQYDEGEFAEWELRSATSRFEPWNFPSAVDILRRFPSKAMNFSITFGRFCSSVGRCKSNCGSFVTQQAIILPAANFHSHDSASGRLRRRTRFDSRCLLSEIVCRVTSRFSTSIAFSRL